tara:strand:- start:246 stop:677 length:432 start_codon:yes stop_codon:yes gene_type:complete
MMKLILFILAAITVAIIALNFHRLATPIGQVQDWAFIESVGGMKVERAGPLLLVDCNVSGTETITKKPTMQNSGMGVQNLSHTRAGNKIFLTVSTSLIGKGTSAKCGNVDISNYPPGSYNVLYLNPDGTTHLLKKVTLPKADE